MMSFISERALQPSPASLGLNDHEHLHLEHLSQRASFEAAGVLMISYLLIKARLCLIYQSGCLFKAGETEKLILPDSLLLRGHCKYPRPRSPPRCCAAEEGLDQMEGGD